MLYFDVEADWQKMKQLEEGIKKIKDALKDVSLDDAAVSKMTEQLKTLQTEFDALIQKASLAGDAYMQTFANNIKASNDNLANQTENVKQASDSIGKYTESLSAANTELDKTAEKTTVSAEKLNEMIESTGRDADAMADNMASAFSTLMQLSTGLEVEAMATQAEIERLEGALVEYQKAAEKAAQKGDRTNEELFNIQIGNIQQGLEDAQKNLEAIEKAKAAIDEQTAAFSDNMKEVVLTAAEMKKLRDEIEKVAATMKEMEAAGQTNTAEYQAQQEKLNALAASYSQASENITKFNQDAGELPSASGDFGEFAEEVLDGVDAIAKLTGNNEDLVNILNQVKSVMATTTKLQGIANTQSGAAAKQNGALAKVLAALMGKWAANVTGARGMASAVRGLATALSTGPLIIITAVITALGALYKMWKKNKEEQQKFYKDTAQAAAKPIASFQRLSNEWKNLDLEGKEQFIKKNAKAFDELGMSINNVADAERLLNEQSEKFVDLQILKAKAATLRAKADEKAQESAEKSIELQDRNEKEQWGNAEDAVKRLELRLSAAMALGPAGYGMALKYTKQLIDARKAMAKGEDYWLEVDEWAQKRLEKSRKKLNDEIKKYNTDAENAEKEANEKAKELGIDTGEITVNSIAYYKQQISIEQKKLEKLTDTTGAEAEEIRRRIQENQNAINEITGDAAKRAQKLADDQEKTELNNQQRLINIQKKGVEKQLALIDNETKQKEAAYKIQKRELATQLSEGKITGKEWYEADEQLEKNWKITQQEQGKKRADVLKAEARREQQFQDDIVNQQISNEKRQLQVQEDSIGKKLALIDLEYKEKINEYEKQERELQKKLEDKEITQADYNQQTEVIKTQRTLTKQETDKQKREVTQGLIDGYLEYDAKRRDIENKFMMDRLALENIVNDNAGRYTEAQKDAAEKALVRLDTNKQKELLSLKMDELVNTGDYQAIFQNMQNFGLITLKNLKAKLDEVGESIAANLDPADAQAFWDAYENVVSRITELDPSTALSEAKVKHKETTDNLRKVQDEYNNALKNLQKLEKAEVKDEMAIKKAKDAVAAATEKVAKAEDEEAKANEQHQKAIDAFLSKVRENTDAVNKFADELKNLGDTIGGTAGEILDCAGDILNFVSSTVTNITSLVDTAVDGVTTTSRAATAALKAVETASVILAIIGAAIQLVQKLLSFLPDDRQKYNDLVDKQSEINNLKAAVRQYRMEVIKAGQAERNWFSSTGLSNLKDQGELASQALKNYNDILNEVQATWQDERGGGKFWNAMDDAWNTTAGKIGDYFLTGYSDPLTLAAQYINKANTTASTKPEQEFSKAIDNLRIETKAAKKGGWFNIGARNQETMDLREWTKQNLGQDLFDEATGFLNEKAYNTLMDKYSDKLMGETKETLEQLKENQDQYNEWKKAVREYAAEMYEPVIDNYVDALFNWLDTGEDVMDTFENYASDTFRNIGKEFVKTLYQRQIFDKYSQQLQTLYEEYSKPSSTMSEEELAMKMAQMTGQMKQEAAATTESAQTFVTMYSDLMKQAGFDITSVTGQQSAVAGAYQTMSEDTAGVLEGRFTAVYESNLAIQGTLAGIGDEVSRMANTVVANYQTVSDIRNIVVESNLNLQTIAQNTTAINGFCKELLGNSGDIRRAVLNMA